MRKRTFVAVMAILAKKIGGKFGQKWPKIAKIWPKNGLNGLKWPKIA